VKVNFVGDIGVFKKFEDLNIDPFGEIYLPESDFNVGNFEFVLPQNKKKFFYDVQEKYSCSLSYFNNLRNLKFNALGLANNHVLDYGLEGAQEMISVLKDKNIEVFGFSTDEEFSMGKLRSGGVSIGIIACVKKGRWSKEKYGYGPDNYDKVRICECIYKNKNEYDHIVVYPHWGTELVEIPDLQDTVNAKSFIDAGASAVIGHHPHVSQGIEVYHDGIIAYSLGSFIYVHEEELGYSAKNSNRHISICLQVEFSEKKITGFQANYYTYNQLKKIPELLNNEFIQVYSNSLNENIYNQKLFRNQFTNVFINREIRSFRTRFMMSPLKTVVHYTRYIIDKIINKLKPRA
jgi:hypothetical protein